MPCDAENAGDDGLGCRVMQRMLVPMVCDGLGCHVMLCDAENAGAYGLGWFAGMLGPWDAV